MCTFVFPPKWMSHVICDVMWVSSIHVKIQRPIVPKEAYVLLVVLERV